MEGFGILFIIFGLATFLVGLAFYHGHFSKEIFWQARWKSITKDQIKTVGNATMWISVDIFLTGLTGLFFEEENITPVIVLLVLIILTIIILKRKYKQNSL